MEHRKCECCREKFLLKDMKDDLCVCCYNFIQKRKDKTISDLEEKLAESEKRLVNCVDFNTWQKTAKENIELEQQLANMEKSFAKVNIEDTEKAYKLTQLEKQLAEKDEEIDILKKDYEFVAKQYKELMRTGGFIIEQKDQDKISFAVEQLEKVKEWIDEEVDVEYTRYIQITDYIDNQIKQLKEMKQV